MIFALRTVVCGLNGPHISLEQCSGKQQLG